MSSCSDLNSTVVIFNGDSKQFVIPNNYEASEDENDKYSSRLENPLVDPLVLDNSSGASKDCLYDCIVLSDDSDDSVELIKSYVKKVSPKTVKNKTVTSLGISNNICSENVIDTGVLVPDNVLNISKSNLTNEQISDSGKTSDKDLMKDDLENKINTNVWDEFLPDIAVEDVLTTAWEIAIKKENEEASIKRKKKCHCEAAFEIYCDKIDSTVKTKQIFNKTVLYPCCTFRTFVVGNTYFIPTTRARRKRRSTNENKHSINDSDISGNFNKCEMENNVEVPDVESRLNAIDKSIEINYSNRNQCRKERKFSKNRKSNKKSEPEESTSLKISDTSSGVRGKNVYVREENDVADNSFYHDFYFSNYDYCSDSDIGCHVDFGDIFNDLN